MQKAAAKSGDSSDQQLLRTVAGELKLPLVRIARLAELSGMSIEPTAIPAHLQKIGEDATIALQLVDSYLLGLELRETQQELNLEPISIGSVLHDVTHQLFNLASDYGVTLELSIHKHQQLVMGHKQALKAAYLSMGSTMIRAQSNSTHSGKKTLTFVTHSRADSILAGIYGEQGIIHRAAWERERNQNSKALQPFLNLSNTNGAGFFIADNLLRAMKIHLQPSRHQKHYGLAATMAVSHQLQLV